MASLPIFGQEKHGMIAQYRPDIARAIEETVVNLKGLEQTLEILRNDLAWLAQSIGHPQAAQVALTPTRTLAIAGASPFAAGIGQPGTFGLSANAGQVPMFGFQPTPFGASVPPANVPYAGLPYGSPMLGYPNMGAVPGAIPNVGPAYAPTVGVLGVTPYLQTPPYATTNPYGTIYR
jgi:hypothetical protein